MNRAQRSKAQYRYYTKLGWKHHEILNKVSQVNRAQFEKDIRKSDFHAYFGFPFWIPLLIITLILTLIIISNESITF